MREKNDVLEQALALIAAEETRAMEQQMTFQDMQAAKKMQQINSKENLSLIRRHTRSFRAAPFLRAAAAIALVAGGLMLLRTSAPEKTDILTPAAPSLSVQTNSPSATLEPTIAPTATISPTQTPFINIVETFTATPVPLPTIIPSPDPTAEPTVIPTAVPTPLPTATPSPAPTAAPVVVETALPAAQHPDGWQGSYFPGKNPGDWVLKSTGGMTAVYDDNYEFTEHASIVSSLSGTKDIEEYQYVMIHGVPALLTEDRAGQFTLTWDVDGQTLSLFSPDGDKETLLDIANSVIKLPED